MEAHITSVSNGIARSMAPSGLKKALSFEAVRLALQEQVQAGLAKDQILQRTKDRIVILVTV